MYFAHIEIHVRFGITDKGASLKVQLNALETLQRRFLCIVMRNKPGLPWVYCTKKAYESIVHRKPTSILL